jgi:hypothetical protein
MTYRNDVDALEARKAALEFEVSAKTRERDDAARLLHEAQARGKLPILDNIKIASPCNADWELMTGDDRVRHCHSCNKDVFNLSLMSREEAELLMRERTGGLCVRYFQRQDGTILLDDCKLGSNQRRRRRLIVAGAAIALGGGLAAAVMHEKSQMVMGQMRANEMSHALMGDVGPPTETTPRLIGEKK